MASRFVVLLVVFSWQIACGCLCLAFADEIDASRERLSGIQERLESTERSLKQKTTEARSLRNELRSVNQELRSLENRQKSLKRSIRENSAQQVKVKKDVEALNNKIDAQRIVLGERLSSLYKAGDGGVLRLLFSGLSPAELDSQFRYTLRIVGHDRALLEGYRDQQQELHAKLSELEELKRKHSLDLEKLRRHSKVLASAHSLKKQILDEVRKDQRLLSTLKKELQEKATRLEELVRDIEASRGGGRDSRSAFAQLRGRLPWPANGPVRITYGPQRHPDLGTLFDSNGIEIDVPPQTPVKALWEGRVAFANAFKGYGNLLIIDHGDGYHSLYAHVSRMLKSVDARVEQGDVIAYSGYPGMEGVYLEIRRQGKSVDPENWLKKP